jgi:hypothetical protein
MSNQMTNSIAAAISALPSPYPPIILTKHYKGTCLNQQGRIVAINPNSATIQATQRLTFHILSGMVHLRTGVFPGAISATIHPVDFAHGTFHLSDLSYNDWQERRAERVQPKYPTYVILHFYKKTFRAYLEDISTVGLGLLANSTLDPDGKLRPGVKILLEFQLPPQHSFIHLMGTLVYRKIIGPQLVKFGIHLRPNTGQKSALQDYITLRYDEILRELEQDYIRLLDPCRVENLYF